MWDFKWFSPCSHRPASWTLEHVFTIFHLQADQHYCKCPMITIYSRHPWPTMVVTTTAFQNVTASVYSLPYVVPPWKKKRYRLFPQPLGGPRPIWAINIQTGIFVSWGKETADTHSRWDDALPYKCWPSDKPQHSHAASTPRDKHKCRDKRAGVMTSPLPVYALPVLYAPVLKHRAKLFTWENLVNLYFYYLTDAHMKPYWRQKKH